ncbi:MAG: Zn-dependent hydrolase, glyoxylase [Bacteroidota bacterium]|jgi:glyoxylase-like metal-dependent hydrolase (beta-lactamase superfamily II)|nr:Zn-dependent hydrolase, glyoxylase [Bacteroidota bacterium]
MTLITSIGKRLFSLIWQRFLEADNMIRIKSFTFSPIQENTYILYDDIGECVIIDPGCYDDSERQALASFIEENKLKPVRLLNTHCHLDHIFGNGFVSEKYNLKPEFNKHDLPVFHAFAATCNLYGLSCDPSPEAESYLDEGDVVKFGESSLEIVFTPGHSPGSITFYNKDDKFMISGDVLFYGSVGRTDLPGGSMETLVNSIKTKLFPLGDDFKVYSGHGPSTTIGFEKKNNPFLQ